MRKNAYLFLIVFFALNILTGCATQTTTTKTVKNETVQHSPGPTENKAEPAVVEKQQTTETTTQTTEEGKSGGLLSGTVHAVGQVLALPFRAVGGLISLVF